MASNTAPSTPPNQTGTPSPSRSQDRFPLPFTPSPKPAANKAPSNKNVGSKYTTKVSNELKKQMDHFDDPFLENEEKERVEEEKEEGKRDTSAGVEKGSGIEKELTMKFEGFSYDEKKEKTQRGWKTV